VVGAGLGCESLDNSRMSGEYSTIYDNYYGQTNGVYYQMITNVPGNFIQIYYSATTGEELGRINQTYPVY
jgi:hypothetical protein